MNNSNLKIAILFLLLLTGFTVLAQDENNDDNSIGVNVNGVKGWHVGFYGGGLFANKYAAYLYDGYGIDIGGNKNVFGVSNMFKQMVLNGLDATNSPYEPLAPKKSIYEDRIAQALGVDHDHWRFNSIDMPIEMKYSGAFVFGLAFQYGINKREGLIFNTNFAKLNATGTFTIETQPQINSTLGSGFDSILYFPIKGQEQRFNLQIGYSRLLGDLDQMFNFLIEGGVLFNSTKYLNNYAYINTLQLDMTPFTYNGLDPNYYLPREYNATGFGAFAGFGCNVSTSKYLVQLVYNPSYERIGTGEAPTPKLQHYIGLRVYYGL